MEDGWKESASAWIDGLGTDGDWARRVVLDRPMLCRIAGRRFGCALDVGCGEGRFCRSMKALGIATIGIDPTEALVVRARHLDPAGDYRVARAEALDLDDGTVDLAVAYLSLIDIADLSAAIAEVHRVLRPGGTFLIANLQSFNTANPDGWNRDASGRWRFNVGGYFDEGGRWVAWGGIQVRNWHRPLSTYLQALLDAGFALRHFAEPEPGGAPDERTARYREAPYLLVMEWQKADASS